MEVNILSLHGTTATFYTHVSTRLHTARLTACPVLLPGGSQREGGRDFTLDLPLTAL